MTVPVVNYFYVVYSVGGRWYTDSQYETKHEALKRMYEIEESDDRPNRVVIDQYSKGVCGPVYFPHSSSDYWNKRDSLVRP